jgi:dTDP-glucose 4,6-dehydratase
VRALVTGGAGFLGSHLVDRLVSRRYRVTVVDDLSTGDAANLTRALGSGLVKLFRLDASDAPNGSYDRVFHLASPASPVAYELRKIGTLLANSEGTKRCLDIAARCGAAFLLASTSEIYGDPLEHPQKETYWGNVNPVGPRSQYDEGKRYAEALTMAYVNELAADCRVVRIFNSYGPRMKPDDGRMPSAFVEAALTNEPIRVHGDGSQTRSLCYVDDTVRGILAAMDRGKAGSIYNIGNPRELSVVAFALAVKKAASSKSAIVHVAARIEDIARRKPDISKAKAELGWKPIVDLETGLSRTIAWRRRRRDGSGSVRRA